jgi:2-polyprenyl-3-methyl-5-hydroxy-6-metoxy-1,4-benzoquinol methylase
VRYAEQQKFLMHSRIWGAAAAVLVLALAAACLGTFPARSPLQAIEFGLTALALAISIYYTPDYLHLTVDAKKRQGWEIKIRWRVIGAALVLALLSVRGVGGILALLAAVAWLAAANLLAGKLLAGYCSFYFWITDFVLLAYLSLVISERDPFPWTGGVLASGCLLLEALWVRGRAGTRFFLLAAGLLLVSALATAFLVWRARRRNASNVRSAMRELEQFTGLAPEDVRRLWSVSNQELAKNWKLAGLDEADPARLAEWYRENSQLYMFAISAYNLEFKRIRSNLKVLRFARGATLDYGAGNGEIVLELARRGHRVAYYDVAGMTMKFARERAAQQRLEVEFCHAKESLAASAGKHGFDTVFSFDVLEHLPDLPGELRFLSSLLNPGGLFLFDVPAGSTKAHPMHLNHHVDVGAHMRTLGLKQERSFLQRLSFRKEEKFFFRK